MTANFYFGVKQIVIILLGNIFVRVGFGQKLLRSEIFRQKILVNFPGTSCSLNLKLSVFFRHLFFDLNVVNAFIFAVILEGFTTI